MPLNYSKWDQLELSDDSDIEGHPNVDKRSLIRWQQRDIHERREIRKAKIAHLRAEIDVNKLLLPRLQEIAKSVSFDTNDNPQATFNQLAEKLKVNPSPDAPPSSMGAQTVTYDDMVLSLLLKVGEEAKKRAGEGGDAGLELKGLLDKHITELDKQTQEKEKDLEGEIKEQKKHITSEDLHDGFDSKYVPPKPVPVPVSDTKKSKTTTTTTIEVLNPESSSSSLVSPDQPVENEGEGDEETTLPSMTPVLKGFSELPLWDYQASFNYIQSHPEVVYPGAQDALLVAAFRSESSGDSAYAKKCVHQSKLLDYCKSLGKDGVRLFFQRMMAAKSQAISIFVQAVEDTYEHLVTRVAVSLEEERQYAGQEQIQLVPENPEQSISFNVPEGPPPENLVLEGPDMEGYDVEDVKKALQMRWHVFSGFPEDLQEALRGGKLEMVNKVLGNMKVEDAEGVVKALDMGGILSFAESGVRDQTGKAEEDDVQVDGKGKEKA